MGEKRGETVKLQYDFNTAGCLEICRDDKWYRVTSKDFRSYNGKRRITEQTVVIHGNVNVPTKTYDYYGPVYQYGTNNIVEYTESGSLEITEEYTKLHNISSQRR